MDRRSLKTVSLAFAGLAGLSLSVSAATDSLKTKPTTPRETSAPAAPMDSVGKRKAPSVGQTSTPGATAPGATTPGAAGATAAVAPPTDAQIMGMVNAVDKHEIDAANKALKEKMSAEAAGYARMLKEQHTANMARTKSLGKTLKMKAAKSPAAEEFRAKGEAQVKTMAALDSAQFERAYLDAMVTGHAEVLQMLDSQLIPAAKNDSLKSHLNEVRGHVSAHLEQGKRLQEAQASRAE